MKKALWIIFIFFSFGKSQAQKFEDNRILVTVNDTTKLYERTRQAIVNSNFIIRPDSKRDTLVTSVERVDRTTHYMVAKAIIKGNSVEISGAYGLKYEDFWGFPTWPQGYKRIIYFLDSQAWKILRQIAIKLDGEMTYYKVD